MNAQKLFTEVGKFAGVYFCEKCNIVGKDKDFVDQCCICRICDKPFERGVDEFSHCYHKKCWHEKRHADELQRLEDAELVEDYKGPVYFHQGWGQDGFVFDDVEEILADNVEHPDEWPEFAFCCKEHPFPAADESEIVERCAESMFEDAYDYIEVPKSLVEGIKEFNELNKHILSYDPDYKRKVKLPPMPEELKGD